MTQLVQYIVAGIGAGSLYGVLALGVTALLRGTDIPNFAQGAFGLVASYVTYWLASRNGVPAPVAIVAGLAASAAIAYLADRIAMRRMIDAPIVSLLIFTLGLSLALTNGALLLWGPNTHTLPALTPGGTLHLGDVELDYQSLTLILIGAVIAGATALFFDRTRRGTEMRAVSEHRVWPGYLGIDVARVLSSTWLLGGLLGGVAGVLITSTSYLDPNVMEPMLIKAFTAAAIGGFSSILGAYAGGLILGVAESLAAGYISADFQPSIAFFFLLIILILRPQGLFGTRIVRAA